MNSIVQLVLTSDDVRQMRGLAQRLLELVYKAKNQEEVRETIKKELPERMFERFLVWYEDLVDRGKSLNELIVELDELEVVKIKLSFDPSEAFLEEIVETVREKLGEKRVVEVEVDHNILGGVVLEVGGKFIDLSLKKIFEEKYVQV